MTRKLGVLALALATFLGLLLVPGTAYAGPSCTRPLCSQITNETPQKIGVAMNWCTPKNGPCTNNDQNYDVLGRNDSTPSGEDWDTFFVPSDCTYSGIKHSWGINFSASGGSAGKWVRVHNDEHYYIKRVSCS
jgi:hypothetical protein